jgi:hypothetical protein
MPGPQHVRRGPGYSQVKDHLNFRAQSPSASGQMPYTRSAIVQPHAATPVSTRLPVSVTDARAMVAALSRHER